MTAGVNISTSTRRELNSPRQIFEMGPIVNRTMLVGAVSTLWQPEHELCKVSLRPPHPGPACGSLAASLGMCAHGQDGKRD